MELADAAAADKLAGTPELAVIFAALLGARLIDPSITPHRREHGLALAHGHCARLLAIDVFAGLGGHGGHRRVPVGRGGDQHGVNVRAGQHLAKVGIGLAGLVVAPAVNLRVMVIDLLGSVLAAVAPDIAHSQHLDIFAPRVAARHIRPRAAQQVAAALAADADEPHRDALAGRHRARPAQDRCRNKGRRSESGGDGGGCLAQEMAAGECGC